MTAADKLKYDLGDLLVRFSGMEASMLMLMAALLEESNTWLSVGICAELTSRKRVEVLEALVDYRVHDAECRKFVAAAVKSFRKAEEVRNRAVHMTWLSSAETGEVVARMKLAAKSDWGFMPFSHQISDRELVDAIERVKDAQVKLGEAIRRLESGGFLRFRMTKPAS